jgi:hypothetical protein
MLMQQSLAENGYAISFPNLRTRLRWRVSCRHMGVANDTTLLNEMLTIFFLLLFDVRN